jgi:hypothetical protein
MLRPIFVDRLDGPVPRLRQNLASFCTVSGNATFRCLASTSRSHWSRLRPFRILQWDNTLIGFEAPAMFGDFESLPSRQVYHNRSDHRTNQNARSGVIQDDCSRHNTESNHIECQY